MPAGAHAAEQRQAAVAAPASPAAIAEYRRALAEYQEAQAAYAAEAEAYWSLISQKRRARTAKRASQEPLSLDDYVLTQPPVYSGPPKPVDPSQTPEEKPPSARPVRAGGRRFSCRRPDGIQVPCRASRKAKLNSSVPTAQVALAAGLNKQQIVRIYSFEAGGNGGYDVQAGLEHNKSAHAITTALGYNQLLATNSVEVVAESGSHFVKALRRAPRRCPGPREPRSKARSRSCAR